MMYFRRRRTPPTPWRRGAQSVVDACEASRKRLGVEQIDLYQIHMPDVVQPGRFFGFVECKDEEYWEGLARCKELGLVREIGVSNYGPSLLRKCSAFMAKRGLKLASNQIHYSLLARHKGNNQATVRRAYYGCISYVDSLIGELLQALKDGGAEWQRNAPAGAKKKAK